MTDEARTCFGCGRPRRSHLGVCGECWKALPSRLRYRLRRADTIEKKRAASFAILKYARAVWGGTLT